MKFTSTALLFLCLTANAFAQIPNAGMENWSEAPQLTDWTTNSYPMTLPPYDPYIVRQDANAHSGSYAANFYGNGVLKPYATTTFELTGAHPTQLDFWYQLSFAPCINGPQSLDNDTASILVELLLNGNVVDQGYWESFNNQPEYILQSIALSQNALAWDSCRITITGGKVFGGCGIVAAATEFRVDDLMLQYPAQGCINPDQIDPNVFCIAVYEPVCGCDGITYSNSCFAEFQGGVTSYTPGACGACVAAFEHSRDGLAFTFTDQSLTNISSHSWNFGDGSAASTEQNPTHTYAQPGWYEVCLTVNGLDNMGDMCNDMLCDSVYATDGCIDSSLICVMPSLCCDAPLFEPVCGCNNVTYDNSCVAMLFGGVLQSTPGACVPSGIADPNAAYTATLMPNPAQTVVQLDIDAPAHSGRTITIRNMLGQQMLAAPMPHTRITIDIASLPSGIYALDIATNGRPEVVKLLVRE